MIATERLSGATLRQLAVQAKRKGDDAILNILLKEMNRRGSEVAKRHGKTFYPVTKTEIR